MFQTLLTELQCDHFKSPISKHTEINASEPSFKGYHTVPRKKHTAGSKLDLGD